MMPVMTSRSVGLLPAKTGSSAHIIFISPHFLPLAPAVHNETVGRICNKAAQF